MRTTARGDMEGITTGLRLMMMPTLPCPLLPARRSARQLPRLPVPLPSPLRPLRSVTNTSSYNFLTLTTPIGNDWIKHVQSTWIAVTCNKIAAGSSRASCMITVKSKVVVVVQIDWRRLTNTACSFFEPPRCIVQSTFIE
jgi:hypothetical protein